MATSHKVQPLSGCPLGTTAQVQPPFAPALGTPAWLCFSEPGPPPLAPLLTNGKVTSAPAPSGTREIVTAP
jgi:hypothetical protein